MRTKTFTRTVCRTGYGHQEITVHLPANASEADIEAAVLAEAPSHEFSDSDADYELVDGSNAQPAVAENQVIDALQTALRRAHRTLRKGGYDMTEIDQALAMADQAASTRVLIDDLVEPHGTPADGSEQEEMATYRGSIYLYGSVRTFMFHAPTRATAGMINAAALAAITRHARFAWEKIGTPVTS